MSKGFGVGLEPTPQKAVGWAQDEKGTMEGIPHDAYCMMTHGSGQLVSGLL